jgi:hypothetical protein
MLNKETNPMLNTAFGKMPAHIRRQCSCLLAAASLVVSLHAIAASPDTQTPPAATPLPALKTVGTGQYRYLFWDLYQARLASEDGRFVSYQQSRPLLLELTYQRDIKRDDFIEATLDQWQHLHGTVSASQQAWAQALKSIWQDVKKGDRLACLLREDGTTAFFLNDQPIGGIEDVQFAGQFLDIWLSVRSSAPKLRRQLLAGTADVARK